MVVRDGRDPAGLEVLMLRRHLGSAFAGGAYVFPGGALDEADRDPALAEISLGRSDPEASRHLEIESGGLAFYVAAVRETFEEAGILLATDASGSWLPSDDPAFVERLAGHRHRLNAGEADLPTICRQEGWLLALDRVEYFSHWVTPVGAPRRFDTRFFVAVAPPGQLAAHDEGETIESIWIRPSEALERHRIGKLDLIFPTIRNLQAISTFESATDLLAAAAKASSHPVMLPRVSVDGAGMRILLPGDPGYDEAAEDAGILENMPLPGRPGGPLHQ